MRSGRSIVWGLTLLTIGAPVAAHAAAGAAGFAALAAMQAARQRGSGGGQSGPRAPNPDRSASGKRPKPGRVQKSPTKWKQHTVQAGLVLGGLAAIVHGFHRGDAVEMAAGTQAFSTAPLVTNPAHNLRSRLRWTVGTTVATLGAAKLMDWGMAAPASQIQLAEAATMGGLTGWILSTMANLGNSLLW
jgi:hypothetical protein